MIISRPDLLKIAAMISAVVLVIVCCVVVAFIFHPRDSSVKHAYTSENTTSLFVTVDVSGAVRHPGLYHMSPSRRIADVITQAGGFLAQADLSYIAQKLDLAKKLRDEQKIYIPYLGQNWSQSDQESGSDLISINVATSDQLATLPGISKKKALEIVALRPYSSLSDFQQRAQISARIFQNIQKIIVL